MKDNIENIENFLNWYQSVYGNTLYSDGEFVSDAKSKFTVEETLEPQQDYSYKAGDSELDRFYHEIKDCRKCHLTKTRKNLVFGDGNPESEVMFIGEAPGAEEDAKGKTFVGRAGKLLDKMLFAIGLKREDIFIANVLKCRPPNNRDPLPEEIMQCEPYLIEQIKMINPRVLVALGRVSGQMLAKEKVSLKILRSREFRYNNVPLIITYHPAALLRNPNWKSEAWIDFKKIKSMIGKDSN